jgi:NADPH:quinone reductase-like Zn-dependent oxidoreductase
VNPDDAVYGMSPAYGTFAEYVSVKANGVALKPRSLNYVDAAAVPLTGLTAWQTLFNLAELQSGERILINGAGGGIGSLAVQLAKNAGAHVIALDRGDKEALVKELGADEFIDAKTQRFEDVIDDVDVVLDLIGGEFVERSLEVCKPGGRYVTPAAMLPPNAGESQGVKAMGTFTQPTVEELTKLAEEIDAGRLKVHVNRTFPLDQIQDAMAYKQEGGVPGKIAVTVG